MSKKAFLCLALLIGIVLSASPVLSYEKTLFGPKTHIVGRFHFGSSFDSFKVEKPGDAILEITNASSYSNACNGYLNLNGRFFSLHPVLHTKGPTVQVPVQLRSRNYLFVFLYGQRGAGIKLAVKEAKQEPVNHEPIALDQTVGLDEDTTVSLALSGSDQDGDPLTFRIVSSPAHGTLSGDAPALSYAPSADYNGSDLFTFIVNDGKVDSKPATVNITIRAVNDHPRAVAFSTATAKVGEPVALDGSKSTDVDGDNLTYVWTWASFPPGLEPVLSNSTSPLASFVPYLPGEYRVRLVVNDGAADSPAHIITVSAAYPPFSLTEEKLTAGDGAAGNRFGSSLSIDNYRAIIGSEGKEAAYIFESQSPWAEKARLVSGKAGDGFGSAVSVSGDYALAGAHGDDDLGIDSGAAYLFKFDEAQWSRLPKLTADDGKAGDIFGASIALSSDLAVVGAPGDDTNDGNWVQRFGERKYLPLASGMSWNTFLQQWENRSGLYILEANSADGWARNFRPLAIRVSFGALSSIPMLRVVGTNSASLAYSNNYLLRQPLPLSNAADIRYIYVSNPPAVTNIEFLVPSTKGAVDAGSVYVFKRGEASWPQQSKLTASDGAEGDAFGVSVAVSDQTIIVGAEGDDDQGQDSGSAYLFYQDGTSWVEEAKLLAKSGKMGDRFGASVALSGNVAVVGAPHPNVADGEPGSACVFRFNGDGWIEEARLTALDGKAGDRFGASVSISADYIVVGAPGADGSGAYYVFKFDGSEWTLKGKGVPTDKADGQEFGGAVSISGEVILSGAAGDSEKDDQAGAAYADSIDTYHTAGIHANPDIIKAGLPTELSWSWVNAMVVQIDPGIGAFDVTGTATGSGGAEVSPDVTTTYRITAYGPYGKDVASVTVFVEP